MNTRRSVPKPETLNPKLRREAARAAHRSLGEAIVRAQAADMDYIGWFIALARVYPESRPHLDWASALATAKRLRLALNLAESLLRADHHTVRPNAAGAALAQAAA